MSVKPEQGRRPTLGWGLSWHHPLASRSPWGFGKCLLWSIPASTCCSSNQPPIWSLITGEGQGEAVGKVSGPAPRDSSEGQLLAPFKGFFQVLLAAGAVDGEARSCLAGSGDQRSF